MLIGVQNAAQAGRRNRAPKRRDHPAVSVVAATTRRIVVARRRAARLTGRLRIVHVDADATFVVDHLDPGHVATVVLHAFGAEDLTTVRAFDPADRVRHRIVPLRTRRLCDLRGAIAAAATSLLSGSRQGGAGEGDDQDSQRQSAGKKRHGRDSERTGDNGGTHHRAQGGHSRKDAVNPSLTFSYGDLTGWSRFSRMAAMRDVLRQPDDRNAPAEAVQRRSPGRRRCSSD